MATVAVRFFAMLRERFGDGGTLEIVPGTTAADLWRQTCADLGDPDHLAVRFAVNERYVEPDHVLADGDELAVFPPVSGG